MNESLPRNPKYIAILAIVSATILGVGVWLRPEPDAATATAPPPSETDVLGLTRLAQLRSLESTSDYFASVADTAARSLAFAPAPGVTLVSWTSRLLVAPPGGLAVDNALALPRGPGDTPPTAISGPHLPLVALDVSGDRALIPPARATAAPESGDWLITIWQTASGRAFAPGLFVNAAVTRCGSFDAREIVSAITPAAGMAGGIVVDAEGGLVAMILPCDGRLAAISTNDVDAMLDAGRTLDGRVLATWGFRAEPLAPDAAERSNADAGIIVREVWTGLAADRSGLRAGDIIVAVNGQPVDALDDIRPLADAGTASVSVRRGSSKAVIALSREEPQREEVPPAAPQPPGFVWESARSGFPIAAVTAGSPAARAGIHAGDVVVRIDHVEPQSMAQVERLLRRGGAAGALIEIERQGRRLAVFLP